MKLLKSFLVLLSSSYSFKRYNNIGNGNKFIQNFSKKDKNRITFEKYYQPKNENQKKYVEYLNNDDIKIVISVGPAGTGKTMFACLKAISLLKSDSSSKIIITRPIVAVEDEELGFLPGNLNKKMDPWTRPIMDIIIESYSKLELKGLIENGKIEIIPLGYMRGMSLKNTLIIADEMQNSSPMQMLMLTTRLGSSSKLIITGDLNQTDRKEKSNGLEDLIKRVKLYKSEKSVGIEIIEFKKEDVERSEIVEKILEIYDQEVAEKDVSSSLSEKVAEKDVSSSLSEKVAEKDAALIPLKYISKNYK